MQLRKLQTEFNLSEKKMQEIYRGASGRLNLVRDHLRGEKVFLWDSLYDKALLKPVESKEF
jgi:hypothetical protein